MKIGLCYQNSHTNNFKWFYFTESTTIQAIKNCKKEVGNAFLVDCDAPFDLTNYPDAQIADFITAVFESDDPDQTAKLIAGIEDNANVHMLKLLERLEDSHITDKWTHICNHLGLNEDEEDAEGKRPFWLDYIDENRVWADMQLSGDYDLVLVEGYESESSVNQFWALISK